MVAIVHQLRRSRYGELLTAVRDGEERVRFLGYDPALVKVVAYVVAAVFAAIGGALFVPIVGIISPNNVGVVPSIGFLIGVAVGGRATLLGPVLGSLAVSYAGSTLSENFESVWIYLQGLLFVLVVAFLPAGVGSLPGALRRWGSGRGRSAPGDAAAEAVPEGPPMVDDPGPAAGAAVRAGGA
jgi:urea transport system permease protein